MEWFHTVVLIASALLILIPEGLCQEATTAVAPAKNSEEKGIWCYVCNSRDDTRCGHPFQADQLKPVHCNDLLYLEEHERKLLKDENKTFPNFCRKNIQTVTLSGVTDYRIVRRCGFLPKNKPKYGVEVDEEDTTGEDRCYKRAGTFEVAVTYCTCTGDKCNGAFRTGTGTLTTVLLFIIGLVNFPLLGNN